MGIGSACGGNEPSDPCVPLSLTVTAQAPEPVFDWMSGCPAALVMVTPADSVRVPLWSVVAAPGRDAIHGPVTYGVAPAGIAVMTPAEPLVAGRQYQVQISRTGGSFGFGFQEMGAALFTLP
jgi:hypothetical protein